MWNDTKQARLDALRRKEELGTLSADEERHLASLYAEIDAEEAERLGPAAERMEQETAKLRRRNAELAAILERRRRLGTRMRSQIAQWLDEHERLPGTCLPRTSTTTQ